MKHPKDYWGSGKGQKVNLNHDTQCTVSMEILISTSNHAENALSNIKINLTRSKLNEQMSHKWLYGWSEHHWELF